MQEIERLRQENVRLTERHKAAAIVARADLASERRALQLQSEELARLRVRCPRAAKI